MRNVHVSMYLYGLHTGNKNGVPCVELFCLCDDTFTKKNIQIMVFIRCPRLAPILILRILRKRAKINLI
jgi:hypothetical protein